jgi:hypothetical protein
MNNTLKSIEIPKEDEIKKIKNYSYDSENEESNELEEIYYEIEKKMKFPNKYKYKYQLKKTNEKIIKILVNTKFWDHLKNSHDNDPINWLWEDSMGCYIKKNNFAWTGYGNVKWNTYFYMSNYQSEGNGEYFQGFYCLNNECDVCDKFFEINLEKLKTIINERKGSLIYQNWNNPVFYDFKFGSYN